MERTSSRKTCQKAQPSVEENGLLNGYDDDDDDGDDGQIVINRHGGAGFSSNSVHPDFSA